ncbi:MAG: hypothetical protein AB8I08_00295 [Sandaracinaceae bacterium]
MVRVLCVLALASALLIGGCRRRTAPTDTSDTTAAAASGGANVEPGPPPADLPRVLVIGPGSGPALFLGHESNAAAVGYLNPGTRVRLESSIVNGRIEVLVAGGLATKGWVPVDRIAAYTQQRGRVDGTRAYLGPGDLVAISGAEGENLRVSVRPWLGGANFLGPFEGTFPAAQLAGSPAPDDAEGVSQGECFVLPAGQAVPVYERPGGEVVATVPALDPPATAVVLRQRNDWAGVRIGHGPYLTGYVQGTLTPCAGEAATPAPMVPPSTDGRPYWMSQENGALHQVAAGTRIRFHGRTIARLREAGWARELGRDGEQVDVFVAAGDGVAVRGLVDAEALTLVEGAPAPAEAEPEEDLPPELQ